MITITGAINYLDGDGNLQSALRVCNNTNRISGSFIGSLLGTSTYAMTASYIDASNINGLPSIGGGSVGRLQDVTTLGNNTTSSVVIGNGTVGTTFSSFAQGEQPVTIGNHSHAEGLKTTTVGPNSHAEGGETKALGLASHTEGFKTTAIGSYSHAEGQQTTAKGSYSFASGNNTIANGGQQVFGNYNVESPFNGAFVVGAGNFSERKNAIEIYEISGVIYFKLPDIPTSDPGIKDSLWKDSSGYVRISL